VVNQEANVERGTVEVGGGQALDSFLQCRAGDADRIDRV
jgi:hypothetical protein